MRTLVVLAALALSGGFSQAGESQTTGEDRYYVAVDGNDANDGKSWDTAWASLTNAVAKAPNGARITLGDGRFEWLDIPAPLEINRPLTIDSLNGREKTTLYMTFNCRERALSVTHASAVIRGITFLSNKMYGSDTSTYLGRGCLSMSAGLVDSCTIAGFSCTRAYSTGIAANLTGGAISDTVMTNNYLYTSGGSGQYGVLVMTGKAVADRCTIADNEVASTTAANNCHGAVYVDKGASLRNSLVARNKKASKNSGVSVANGGVVDNCTIVGNVCGSTTEYGGVYAENGALIRNTIIAGNRNQAGERNFTFLGAAANLTNCCAPDGNIDSLGSGNIVATPEFVDAANGDYHLASGACVNGGDVLPWMDAASLDLGGLPRQLGSRPDVGCYEKVAGKLTISALASATYGVDSLEVVFTASVDGADLRGLSYAWYVGGGDEPDFVGADKDVITWKYLEPGIYTVRIEAENEAGEKAAATYEGLVTVAPRVIYVSRSSTAPQKPYASWATAASSLVDALEVAGDDTTVLVAEGAYSLDNVMSIDKRVVLQSKDGPPVTSILPTKARDARLISLSNPAAVISGFTFSNSTYQAVGLAGGTVTNCLFVNNTGSNNTTTDTGGSAICVQGEANHVSHCDFIGNTIVLQGGAARSGAAVCVVAGASCTIDSCRFERNGIGRSTNLKYGSAVYFGDKSSGRVRNCLFAKNSCIVPNRVPDEFLFGTLGLNRVGTVSVENCTFAENAAAGENCAGIYENDGTGVTVANCLFAANTNAVGSAANLAVSAKTVVMTCRETDNLFDFKRPSLGNYRLKGVSPCLNVGTDADWMDGALDLDGNPRIRQGRSDIGCYEGLVQGLILFVR